MKIYEIKKAYLDCYDEAIDPETGEVLEEQLNYEKLMALEDAYDDKMDGIGAWIKNMSAEAKALKAEEDSLKRRRSALERKVDGLKTFLVNVCDGRRGGGTRAKISFVEGEYLVKPSDSKIPDQYRKDSVTRVADTEKIREALRNGIEIPGCRLNRWSVRIR